MIPIELLELIAGEVCSIVGNSYTVIGVPNTKGWFPYTRVDFYYKSALLRNYIGWIALSDYHVVYGHAGYYDTEVRVELADPECFIRLSEYIITSTPSWALRLYLMLLGS